MTASLFLSTDGLPRLGAPQGHGKDALIESLQSLCEMKICVHLGSLGETAMGCFFSRAANAMHGRPTQSIAKPRDDRLSGSSNNRPIASVGGVLSHGTLQYLRLPLVGPVEASMKWLMENMSNGGREDSTKRQQQLRNSKLGNKP